MRRFLSALTPRQGHRGGRQAGAVSVIPSVASTLPGLPRSVHAATAPPVPAAIADRSRTSDVSRTSAFVAIVAYAGQWRRLNPHSASGGGAALSAASN